MVRKSVLDNGIRVITETIPSVHSATLGFWVENGSRHERPSINGISHFIEHMLFKGTPSRSASDIAKEIDSVGGVLNGFTSREYSCYYAKVLADKFPMAIELLSDIVLNSVFQLDDIEKERKVILQEIFMQEDSPDEHVHDLFSQTFWNGHPLGLPILGNRDTVGHMSRQELMDFMAEGYCGDKIIICAAGNIQHQDVVDHISQAFASIKPSKRIPLCVVPQCGHHINIIEKPLEQLHICLGTKALPQDHPQRFAAFLLNVILGGSMSSRLFQKVREEQGLAYSIYSYLNGHSDAGSLVVYAGTSPDDAVKTVSIILHEMRRFKTELVPDHELQSAKDQLRGNLLLSLESTDSRMSRLAKSEIYHGRYLPLEEILDGFKQVTSEKIQGLAEALFCNDCLNLQLIGRIKKNDFPLVDLTLS